MTWPTVSLGDVCEFKYGKSLPAPRRVPGEVLVFGSNGAVGWHDEKLTDGPTIVIGRKGSFGEINYSATGCWPIDTTYFVDGRSTEADLRWLSHLLPTLGLTELNRAAAVPGLNREDAYRQTLLLPPLDEQRRVAAILDQADALRAKRRQGLAHLDDLTQSIFLDMFGDTTTRPTVPLKSYTTLITKGTTPTSVGLAFSGSGIPFLRVQNLAGGTIRFSEGDLFIDQAAHTALRRSHIRRGDLLVSIAGTIGRCAIVPPDAADMNCNQAVAIVRLNDPSLGAWLMAWLSTSDAADQIKASSVTGTISNLSLGQLGSLLVPTSDASRVAEFNQTLARAGRLRSYWEASAHTFEELFTTTQTHAFSGQL